MTAGERDLSGLLRWYPRAWRQRYGDEFLAMVEDTLDGRRPGWRLHLSVAWAGLRERGRRVVPAALRRMAGTKPPWSLGRVGVATTLLALVIFWSMQNLTWVSLSAGAYRQARGAVTVDVFAGLDVVLGVAVTVSGLVAGPAFVRFLRAGGWPAIRRPVAGAAVLTVVGAVPLIRLFLLARSMTFFEMPGPAAYTIWVVATMVPLGAALLLWRRAVMTVASRLELRPQARAVQIVLNAVAVVAALALPPLVGIWNVQVASDDWVQLSLAVLILFGLWRSAPARLWWAWHQAQQVRAGAAE